jgi:YD repeat-containing protein
MISPLKDADHLTGYTSGGVTQGMYNYDGDELRQSKTSTTMPYS